MASLDEYEEDSDAEGDTSLTEYLKPFSASPDLRLLLPPSIYTSCILMTLGDDCGCDFQGLENCFVSTPVMILMILNLVLQGGFSVFILQEGENGSPCDVTGSHLLMYIAFATFLIQMLGELMETAAMALWIVAVRTEESWTELTLGKEEGSDKTVLASGMTLFQKIVFLLFIIMPKLGITILLGIGGVNFLAKSADNETVILNALALTFVVTIDDICYTVFTPAYVKEVFEDLPPLQIQGAFATASLALGSWVQIVLLGVSVGIAAMSFRCDS
jgi:hypothetical protein